MSDTPIDTPNQAVKEAEVKEPTREEYMTDRKLQFINWLEAQMVPMINNNNFKKTKEPIFVQATFPNAEISISEYKKLTKEIKEHFVKKGFEVEFNQQITINCQVGDKKGFAKNKADIKKAKADAETKAKADKEAAEAKAKEAEAEVENKEGYDPKKYCPNCNTIDALQTLDDGTMICDNCEKKY